MRTALTILAATAAVASMLVSCSQRTKPSSEDIWIRPSGESGERAVWGHKDGIQVDIDTEVRTRGLLRIFTPYLGHPDMYISNYIAMEPVPTGSDNHRGFSEMEMSSLDGKQGKLLWSSDDDQLTESDKQVPARGVVESRKGKGTLSVYIFCEPFDNGADVYVRLRFFEDRPYEFELSTFVNKGSVPLDYFIVTATMGNKERLRNLYLKDRIVKSGELWPDFTGTDFAHHKYIPADEFLRSSDGKTCWLIATSDEEDPASEPCEGFSWWAWKGMKATQYWHFPASYKDAECLLNGRLTYFRSSNPLPGGIAYENFEVRSPFHNGDTFCFGITPQTPEEMIKEL